MSLFIDSVTETDIGAFQSNDFHFYRVRKLECISVRGTSKLKCKEEIEEDVWGKGKKKNKKEGEN